MIDGGFPFVWAAYAVACGSLAALALIVLLRARHWASEAKKLERK